MKDFDPDAPPTPSAVSRAEAHALGLTDHAIKHRLDRGRWQSLFPGTYAPFSGPVPRETWLTAALRYAGPTSALSHVSAAGVDGWRPPGEIIHVTVAANRQVRPQPDLHIHRTRYWSSQDIVADSRLSRTTVERTVLDLVSATTREQKVIGLVTDAIGSRLTTAEQIVIASLRLPRLRHRALLGEMLMATNDGIHSALELAFDKVLRTHGIVVPNRQVREVLPNGRVIVIDTLWDPWAVTAELDGRLGHSKPGEVFRDMYRDNVHAVSGRIPLRYGWSQVMGIPCAVAHQVAEALRMMGWPGALRRCGPTCAP